MIAWTNVTSYRQAKEEYICETWAADVGGLRIVVSRLYGIPDSWFLTCRPWFQNAALASIDLSAARGEALRLVAKAVDAAGSELRSHAR